ncbi:MAG TPA: hypothetical protein PLK30_16580 [Blastocatellia bacterium]|nr:hypothetical protein [Blastocatellia bacterium]
MKKLIRALPLALMFFAVVDSSQVFGQQALLKQWLGPARPQKIVLTPRHRIPVQTNGFDREDIDSRYRLRLEWIDAAWDGAITAYRREYGNKVKLPEPGLISRVTILPTLGYTSNSLDAGATYYKSRVNVRNYSVEGVVYYKSSDGTMTSLCDGGVEEEFIKAIGHRMQLRCFATLNVQSDLRCRPLKNSLLSPMCR